MLKHFLEGDEGLEDGAPWYVWAGLIFLSAVSFWQQATVTEERFVPALNVISKMYNIPDDVAGATLMAAGASSPEFFSSVVALFITHTSLGLGTVVGSEIFNQLCICAGSIFAAPNQKLKLNKAIAIREMGFYGLGIGLMVFALSDRRETFDEEGNPGPKHIYVSFWKAFFLFSGYILYVIVLANFDVIMAVINGETKTLKTGVSYGSLGEGKQEMPFLRTFKYEPTENFVEEHKDSFLMDEGVTLAGLYNASERSEFGYSVRGGMNDVSTFSKRILKFAMYATNTEKPSDLRDLTDIEEDEFDETLSCFLWQQSQFYDKARLPKNAWHLRWFTFGNNAVASEPNRFDHSAKVRRYRKFDQLVVDKRHLLMKIGKAEGEGRHYVWMAPSEEIMQAVVKKCEGLMAIWEKEGDIAEATVDDEVENGEYVHGPITEFPPNGGVANISIHYVLYPLKMALQLTVPDVRYEGSTITTAWIAIVSCLIWLIIGSLCMVTSLETLAKLMHIPDLIVGVTVSAVGTSLPNYVASQVAAKQGLGNMAVSNAFGSNTFNLMMALGLPWTLYIATVNHSEPYSGLVDDGISVSVAIMISILFLHFILMFISGFEMYRWHEMLFIGIYTCYIAYCVAVVYVPDSLFAKE